MCVLLISYILFCTCHILFTIDCAPNPKPKLGYLFEGTLNLEFAKHYGETESGKKISSKLADKTTLQNITISHKDDSMVLADQIKSTNLNNITIPNLELNANHTNILNTIPNRRFSEENDIPDDDSSSDWLEPDPQDKIERIKTKQVSNQILPEKKECNKCIETKKSTTEKDLSQSNKQALIERLLIEPQYYDSSKSEETSKRETLAPNDILMSILRSVPSQEVEEVTEISYDGYDYNINICRYLGNRYLCGYNKNLGIVKDPTAFEDIGNKCVMRGDRIECGYRVGPWGPGVPIVVPFKYTGEQKLVKPTQELKKEIKKQESTVPPDLIPKKSVDSTDTSANTKTDSINSKKACYQQNDRVVCYDIPL